MASTDSPPAATMCGATLTARDFGSTDANLILTAQQCAFFHREGYLALPSIATASEVERLRAIYAHLFDRKTGWKDGNYLDFAGSDDDRAQSPPVAECRRPGTRTRLPTRAR